MALKLLVYSDDHATREQIIDALGSHITPDLPQVQWIEAATSEGFIAKFEAEKPDLLIMDGEAAKESGISLSRRVHVEYDEVPPTIVICGRPQDQWLATWSQADAVLSEPLEPLKVREVVAQTLRAAGK